jgi:predicted ATPase
VGERVTSKDAPLIGRVREKAEVLRALGEHQLVTIVGPPGVGKTRLAREIAPDAVFCSVAGATNADDVLSALAPLVCSGDDDVLAAIAARGAGVIVLDELEGCVHDAHASLRRILSHAPEARLLVTSREPTELEEEVKIELGPLDEADAVRLFVDRARAVRHDLATSTELPTITEIVRRLDGLPFAIELAATRVSILSPREILSRLVERLDLLRRSRRDGARFATLRESIDASWELLNEHERRALAQLAVFEGAIPVEAAEAVVRADAAVIDLVHALRTKSLVARQGESAVVLYESVRSYAEERLEQLEDAGAVRDRHVAYVEEHPSLGPRDVLAAHRRLRSRDVLRAARLALRASPMFAKTGAHDAHVELLSRAREAFEAARDEEGVARTEAALGAAFEAASRIEDATRVLSGAAERARSIVPLVRAECLEQLGHIEWRRGHAGAARSRFAEALASFESNADEHGQARVMGRMGLLEQDDGRFDEAEALHRGALALHVRAGERSSQALELLHLARLSHKRGLITAVADFAAQARAVASLAGERRMVARAEAQLGVAAQERGDFRTSREAYDHARSAAIELGDRRYFGILETLLAVLDIEDGQLGPARERLAAAIAVHEEVQNLAFEGAARGYLGVALALMREFGEARSQVVEGIACAERASYFDIAAWLWSVRGWIEKRFGRDERARAAIASARALIAGMNEPAFATAVELIAARVEGRGPSLADDSARNVEVRLSRMLVEASPSRSIIPVAPESSAALLPGRVRVDARGRWFECEGRARVPIVRRPSLRLVLAALARGRRDSPGKGIPWAELVSIGWPDERDLGEAGMARVYTLIRTLRRLGLEGALVTQPDGYVLEPDVVSVEG